MVKEGNRHTQQLHTKGNGTGLYMSPEQKKMEFYDEKSDVFAFGLILYELLVCFDYCNESERKQAFKEMRKNQSIVAKY